MFPKKPTPEGSLDSTSANEVRGGSPGKPRQKAHLDLIVHAFHPFVPPRVLAAYAEPFNSTIPPHAFAAYAEPTPKTTTTPQFKRKSVCRFCGTNAKIFHHKEVLLVAVPGVILVA